MSNASPHNQNESTPPARQRDDVMILIPVKNMVLFPGVVMPVALGRKKSLEAAREAIANGRKVGLLLQKDPDVENPEPQDLFRVGTQASIVREINSDQGTRHVVLQGESRFKVIDFIPGLPYLLARVENLPDRVHEEAAVEARANVLKRRSARVLELLPQVPREFYKALEQISGGPALADMVANFLDVEADRKQQLLEELDVQSRLDKVTQLVNERIEVLKLTQEISEQTKAKLDDRQREALLREQLHTIRQQLGESDDSASELDDLRESLEQAQMPDHVRDEALKELRRLSRMPENGAEQGMIRTYLEWLLALPWGDVEAPAIELAQARAILEADHYGLEKVKKRILEYLAVRMLNPTGKSPILCFVGPPGVGKTSLGRSIARAMELEFARVSLGGLHDEAEIRGHRRTYVGALPGNIIQGIRKAGTRNAVFMLDEIDKLGRGFQGDPAAALLEVLDPEQNDTFRDNYLGVDYDLSQVTFIATANVLDNIPGPLRDRMEVIELTGYTEEEKVEIAKRYLVGRQLEANGLTESQVEVSDDALHMVVADYTREAGCRNLERQIGALMRNCAMQIAEGQASHVRIEGAMIPAILGPRRYEDEVALRTSVPGVATGLAWTPVGGDVLFIEATAVPGNGKLILTGQLGDVMKESAQAALTLLKSKADSLGIGRSQFEELDIHVHIPAGAIPKDGPSAGVTLFTAMASLLTGKKVRKDLAMTGEISLRGLVLPVGGIREKTVAAARAGLATVLLPARNRKDLEEIPKSARDLLKIRFMDQVDDVLDHALLPLDESELAPAS